MSSFGVSSSVAFLHRVAMRRPTAILEADPVVWHYAKQPDAARLTAQFDAFVALLEACGTDVEWLDDPAEQDGLADSIFTYDPSFTIADGAIVLRPGKALRSGEAELHERFYERIGLPVLGRIEAPGVIEGGDMFWLDDHTIAVGRGFRTNQAGIDQFAAIVEPRGIDLAVFDLPFHHGPEACLHLMSLVSPLADDLALVHLPLLPVALRQTMLDLGYRLLAAPAEEFDASLGLNLNVLATAPGEVLAIAGFEQTHALMGDAGCVVTAFEADELCIPCEGGPTCLTRPLWRG